MADEELAQRLASFLSITVEEARIILAQAPVGTQTTPTDEPTTTTTSVPHSVLPGTTGGYAADGSPLYRPTQTLAEISDLLAAITTRSEATDLSDQYSTLRPADQSL